jgi:hypothetical protein
MLPWKFDFCHRVGPLDIVGGPWELDSFLVLVPQGSLETFSKRSLWSGYLACVCSVIMGSLLGKRKVKYMGLHSSFPPFYRTYLIEEWYYN